MLNPDKALSLAVSDSQAQSFEETSSQLLQIPAPIAICSQYPGPTFSNTWFTYGKYWHARCDHENSGTFGEN